MDFNKFKKFFFLIAAGLLFVLLTNIRGQDNNFGIIRAVHMGGNWGTNPVQIADQPADYYQFLQRVNVNWAGISVALHIDGSLDDTVEKNYGDNLQVPTFRDAPLRDAIRGLISNNIHVYLTLALETQEASSSQYPVKRTQLGDPFAFNTDPGIKEENWPWNPSHINHSQFVENFWNSYAAEAKYFAEIAEEEGVELFSLGTETDRLFRTRAGGPFPNHFLNELNALTDSVRSVYNGMVTYDMHYGVLEDTPVFSHGSDYLFLDLGLDAVGVSAYFPLLNSVTQNVVPVNDFKEIWRVIFENKLSPLKNRNPNLPILFLEFGYVDSPGSPFLPSIDEFTVKSFVDNNNNNLDDGEEQQANIFEAFYNVNEENGRLVQGTFLWDNGISSNVYWNNSFAQMRTFSIRDKISESIIAEWYGLYKPIIEAPVPLYPEKGSDNISFDVELRWSSTENAEYYSARISEYEDFSNGVLNSPAMTDTLLQLNDLKPGTKYYWQVTALSGGDTSGWSEIFYFTTEEASEIGGAETIESQFRLLQNYPNPFNPVTTIEFTNGRKSNGLVTIKVYDVLGNEVSTLLNKYLSPGKFRIKFDASELSSGIYIYRLTADKFADSKKMLLIK